MVPTGCPETRVRTYRYTLRNIPEDHRCHLLLSGSLKPCEKIISFQNCFGILSRLARERVKRRFLISNVSAGQTALCRGLPARHGLSGSGRHFPLPVHRVPFYGCSDLYLINEETLSLGLKLPEQKAGH